MLRNLLEIRNENSPLHYYHAQYQRKIIIWQRNVLFILRSKEETIKIGEELGKLLKPGTIIGLNGELGTGKTVFVKGIARGLNTREEPNSPTFVIMNKYEGRIPLYHFDLYRIRWQKNSKE